jgi:predicted RNase H-like HicB family nuclease
MATFIGVVHKDSKSDFGVSFPDFPGCITAGRTLDEAMEMAREALRGHIEVMHEFGDALPSRALTLDEAKKHAFAKGAAMFIAVEAPLPSKPVRVNVMLDSNLLHRIDRFAENRSAFLATAARNELQRQQPV